MKYVIKAIITAMLLVPAWAIEQPNSLPEIPRYPIATLEGLDTLKLGQTLPSKCLFPGLSFKTAQKPDYDENGHFMFRTTLKIYHQGYYLGRGVIDKQGRLVELQFVDWRLAFEGKFASHSNWQTVQAELPDAKLHYADQLHAIVAESLELPGLQVHFAPSSYPTKSELKGEFTALSPSKLPFHAKAKSLRLFWIPTE